MLATTWLRCCARGAFSRPGASDQQRQRAPQSLRRVAKALRWRRGSAGYWSAAGLRARSSSESQLAIDISTDAAAGGIRPDFYCGDEVYGNCTQLRGHFEAAGQAYVLRVPSHFTLTLAAGTK